MQQPERSDQQAAFEALPAELQDDVTLTMLVAEALRLTVDIGAHQQAAAALVASFRVREAARAAAGVE